ncbi:MAG: hypothetical protein AMS24_02620 [Chlamydiae bacterium SM23_39]|nr:MAG: hypothetical protein AMS24_02620 [Chlamydiae bacterium SM23_39]
MMKQIQMQKLMKEIQECKKCFLWKTRNIPLIGDGNIDANIMFIGEAPGYYEDLKGKAFVGNAGKIFDQLLEIAKLKRSQIYITNILKCHPPKNKDPTSDSIKHCIKYLFVQLKIVKPKIIVTLGKYATKELFLRVKIPFTKISDIHGSVFKIKSSYGMVKLIAMYHPSSACHNPFLLSILKEDMKKCF